MRGLVSIITPTYNSEAYILEALESVAKQTYIHWEHLIIDDGSTDNTLKIIKEASKKDSRITILRLKHNSGSAVARNLGIQKANGTYLAFIDSDDVWLPNFIENSIACINHSKIPFVFSSYKRHNEKGKKVYADFIVPSKVTYKNLLKTNSIGCLTAFIDIGKLGKKYMPLIRKRQDMGLWLQYLKEIPFAKGIKEPQAIYRIREDSLSRNKGALIVSQWEIYRRVERLSILKSTYYMLCWMYYGYLKYKN